jgi:hypothetical protein
MLYCQDKKTSTNMDMHLTVSGQENKCCSIRQNMTMNYTLLRKDPEIQLAQTVWHKYKPIIPLQNQVKWWNKLRIQRNISGFPLQSHSSIPHHCSIVTQPLAKCHLCSKKQWWWLWFYVARSMTTVQCYLTTKCGDHPLHLMTLEQGLLM